MGTIKYIIKKLFFLSVLLLFWHSIALAVNFNEDSLLKEISVTKDLSIKIRNYGKLGYEFAESDVLKSEKYFQLAMQLTAKALASNKLSPPNRNSLLSLQSELYNDYGYFLKSNLKFQEAIVFYKKSIAAEKQKTDSINESDIATSLVNIGNVLMYIEDIPNALNHFLQAAKIYAKINDEEGIAFANKNIAKVYVNSGNYEKAKLYIDKVVEKLKKLDIQKGLALTLIIQADIYNHLGYKNEAIEQLNEAFPIFKKANHKEGIVKTYIGMGSVFESNVELDSALFFYFKAYAENDSSKDLVSYSNCNLHIANILFKKHQYREALEYALKGYKIANKIGIPDIEEEASHLLSNVYSNLGNYTDAYKMQKVYEVMHDSINKKENNKKIIQKQFQFEYDKKVVADSIKTAQQKQILELQIAQQKNQKNYLIGILFLIALFSGVVYNRLQITRKQRNIITTQKAIVDEKQKEIIDSISYAKRIQQAILPSKKFIDEVLKNFFIMYQPKDIVAGDFYWIAQNSTKLYVAVCDCTGHGVPGALVSVICNNALNRALNEFNETLPGKIFDKARTLILENFAKSDEDVKDGMDASLAAIDFKNNKMWWSGANIPLWIIRKNENESNAQYEFIEIKPNKQPIGNSYKTSSFETHEINLQKNDAIYLFSDGYADQFGGDKNKKITKAKFKEILLQNAHLNMHEQKIALSNFFQKHKGNYEQIDDVCVIGIRV